MLKRVAQTSGGSLGAATGDREARPAIDGRAARDQRHENLSRRGCHVAGRVFDLQGHGVDSAVALVRALGPQLHALAPGRDHHVVDGAPVAVAPRVIRLVARDAGDNDVVDIDRRIATVGSAADKVFHGEIDVLVVGRVEPDHVRGQRDGRCRRVHDLYDACRRGRIRPICSRVGEGVATWRVHINAA